MAFGRNYHSQGSTLHDDRWPSFSRNSYNNRSRNVNMNNWSSNHDFPGKLRDNMYNNSHSYGNPPNNHDYGNPSSSHYHGNPPNAASSLKRRKYSAGTWGDVGRRCMQPITYENAALTTYRNSGPLTRSNAETSTSTSCKRDRSKLEDYEPEFMSRDEIEQLSPSRKDGIDALREAHLRYTYCEFLQNLGLRLELPQTTVGTAMVLCHRFFVRRSHAFHDRFLIATAALFLAAKSEETLRPLNNVLRASCEIFHKQDMSFLSYLLPVDWFEQYRERVTEAELMILTTLNFELNVQHPYAPLTSVLNKLGFSQSVLVNLALHLVSEGLRSSLWLQFKPHHIAAGAAYLAARFLHLDLACYHDIWQEFQTTPAIIQDVAQQLMELL